MATNWSVCALCDALNEKKLSIVWCSECDRGLCSECSKRHSILNATKCHQTVPIEKYGKLPLNVLQTSQTCREHKKSYQKFCTRHESPCCIDCILQAHKGCKNIQNIDDFVENIKKSHSVLECEETLKIINENIKAAIRNREANAASLNDERRQIEREVKSIRQRINAHLDKVENELIKELNDVEKRETMNIRCLVTELQQKQIHVEELKRSIESLKEHASNVQIFLAMKDIEKETKLEEEYVKILFDSTTLNAVSIVFTPAANTDIFVPTIGKLQMSSTFHLLKHIERQQKHAQIVVPKRLVRIEDIGLSLKKKVNVNSRENWGCTFLEDDRYAIASSDSDSVIVMQQDGSEDFRLNIEPYGIVDIVYDPSSRSIIATTDNNNEHHITMIDLSRRKITRSLQVTRNSNGITLYGDKLVYCAAGRGLKVIDMTNNSIKSIKIKSMSDFAYVASYRDNLYYTNGYDTVTCCDINGHIKWQFKKDGVLISPRGICLDNEGFIYVVGAASNNVVVISPDGLHHAVLLKSQDGLDCPIAIDYDRKNDVLLVVNVNDDAFLFNVTK